jgi:hypothetical protein
MYSDGGDRVLSEAASSASFVVLIAAVVVAPLVGRFDVPELCLPRRLPIIRIAMTRQSSRDGHGSPG